MTKTNIFLGVFLLILMVLIPYSSVFAVESTELGNPKASTVNIDGYVFYEDGRNPEGIKVELFVDGNWSTPVALVTTDNLGYFMIPDVDTSLDYVLGTESTIRGYTPDGTEDWIYSTDLVSAVETYHLPDRQLLVRRIYEIDWKYQPNGTTDFSENGLPEGTIKLISSYTQWIEPGVTRLWGTLTDAFCFSCGDYSIYDDPQDFYVNAIEQIYSNNSSGGVHDLGEIALDSVTSVPDISNGVGSGEFYDTQATPAIVGHTYAVVTDELNYYGIFTIKNITIPSNPITVEGHAHYEGKLIHEGIKIELRISGEESPTAVVTTDATGYYKFENVEASEDYWVRAAATTPAFGYDTDYFGYEDFIITDTFVVEDFNLIARKVAIIDWVYQPDGSADFTNQQITQGTISVLSSYYIWTSPDVDVSIYGVPQNGICFSEGSFSNPDCYDLIIIIRENYNSLLGTYPNLSGGIHDMGEVSLESVSTAPDKSNGIGPGEFYSQYMEPLEVGHTYAVVTHDGFTYAKFYVREIKTFVPFEVFLPTILK